MTTHESDFTDRRGFIAMMGAGAAGAGLALPGCAGMGTREGRAEEKEQGEEDVSPAEDLMREHGVLKRVLLVYREAIARIEGGKELPPEPVADAAKLVRKFIEDYHEKLEEDHLFPRYRKAGKLVELVDVLTEQHKEGRRVTDVTIRFANATSLGDAGEKRQLVRSMREFIRMYEPHEAREDTVLFPALHEIVSRNEYDALGEEFEGIERKQLGEDGFERAVEKVAEIEKKLGIYELKQFTPKA